MFLLYVAFALALLVSVGHSPLSQKVFLTPLANESVQDTAFSTDVAKRLTFAMFHFASIFWIGMGVSILMMLQTGALHRSTLLLFAGIYGVLAVGNFWSVRQPHPGGLMLATISGLILAALFSSPLAS
jgi:hypothetical protein